MNTYHEIVLEDLHNGGLVPATLFERIDVAYARRVDEVWDAYLAAEGVRTATSGETVAVPEHAHWRWERKVAASSHLLSYPTLAVECEEQPQGLMLLQTDGEFGRLDQHKSQPLVYVVFLATAPWNLTSISSNPRFRGVGMMLLRAAIEISIDLGFKGRLGLHSLPQSEGFYERQGFTCLGRDEEKQNLKYFEMTAANAAAFIS